MARRFSKINSVGGPAEARPITEEPLAVAGPGALQHRFPTSPGRYLFLGGGCLCPATIGQPVRDCEAGGGR